MGKHIKLFEQHSDYSEYMSSSYLVRPNVSNCIQEDEVHYNPRTWADEYLTIESIEDNNEIYLKATNNAETKAIFVSTDNGETWVRYASSESGTLLATLDADEKIIIKGEVGIDDEDAYVGNYFASTGQFEVKGNIMSLIKGDNFINTNELTVAYAFANLFSDCEHLISAENLILPATTLSDYCYDHMFSNCESLVTTPNLPATNLATGCYSYMFYGCKNLVSVSELPATILKTYCYSSMFNECSSLEIAPDLLANQLVTRCYDNMFYNCKKLRYIKAMFTTGPSLNYTSNWVYGVSIFGLFIKNSSAGWNATSVNSVPLNWTIEKQST